MKNVVLQDERYLPQVEIPDARVWGKYSAWMSAHDRAEARTHYPQGNDAYKALLCKGRLWQVVADKKHHQRDFLGGVRAFSAKNADAMVSLFFLTFKNTFDIILCRFIIRYLTVNL